MLYVNYIYVCKKILFKKRHDKQSSLLPHSLDPGWFCAGSEAVWATGPGLRAPRGPPLRPPGCLHELPRGGHGGKKLIYPAGGREPRGEEERVSAAPTGMTPAQPSSPASPPLSTTWASAANPQHHKRTRYCLINKISELFGNKQWVLRDIKWNETLLTRKDRHH